MNDEKKFIWNLDTRIVAPANAGTAVSAAIGMLERDCAKTLDPGAGGLPSRIELALAGKDDAICGKRERFSFSFLSSGGTDGPPGRLRLVGSDELGLVYGLLHLSRAFLGVDPFWFWMDREPDRLGSVSVDARPFESAPFFVRWRGWFVNDEDCLIGWSPSYPPPREAWLPVFEALLRVGGNMVIPGTDLPRESQAALLAAEMGLAVTHHHAEPLGAEMFLRAHPDLEARYDRYPELYEKLWREAVERGGKRPTVWTLGFRGQGDCPFWEQDPSYDTDEKRGTLIASAANRQREIVASVAPLAPCCSYVYGELTSLYRSGHARLPGDVIRVWADNGYGKMVSRRQGNSNERLPSLPDANDRAPHGVYYHVAFHDLQASNHLTMFANHAALIRDELTDAFARGAKDFLIVNSANVRHQTYALDLASALWRDGDADVEAHRRSFASRFFAAGAAGAGRLLSGWSRASLRYGPNGDDRAGEEFYHHCPRSLIACWMRGERDSCDEDLAWLTGRLPLREQVSFIRTKLEETLPALSALRDEAEREAERLTGSERERFRSFFVFQTGLVRSGCSAFLRLCRAFEYFDSKDYPRSFVAASAALLDYRSSENMLDGEQKGRWKDFYRCDYLTNVGATVYAVDALRKWIRQFGDAPDYFRWSREYTVERKERGIYLENTTRRVPGDDELAAALAVALGESLV